MVHHSICILGSGSLARAICYALATVCTRDITVFIVSRTEGSAQELCYVANARAALNRSQIRFESRKIEAYSREQISPLLTESEVEVVLSCASLQSPWEKSTTPSAWTDLLALAGFGITMPLQAAVPLEVSRAVADQKNPPLFLNASFPDVVNPVLKALDLPIFCGTGNVALLAASLNHALRNSGRILQVLGHHWHLYPPQADVPEALAWLDGTPVKGITELLSQQRATARFELNHVNGLATAHLLDAIVAKRELRTSLPGPFGLPGGYPVRVVGRSIELDLPPGLLHSRAMELNNQWAKADGVQFTDSGDIMFSEQTCAAMRTEMPDFNSTLNVKEIDHLGTLLIKLRERLRKKSTRLRSY